MSSYINIGRGVYTASRYTRALSTKKEMAEGYPNAMLLMNNTKEAVAEVKKRNKTARRG